MITIKPERAKRLTFSISYQGLDLRNSKVRFLIPISEMLVIQVPGTIISDGQIQVKIPPLQEYLGLKMPGKVKGILEIIDNENQYHRPYETDVEFEQKAEITSISLKEEEEEIKEEKKSMSISIEEDKDEKKEVSPEKLPDEDKADLKEDKKPKSKLHKFLDGELKL